MAATGRPVLGPALGRVRPQPRRAAARAVELHLGAGHLGPTKEDTTMETGRSSRRSPTTRPRPRSPSPASPDKPGIAARLFRALADEAVNVDMIVQNVSVDGITDISFTVPKADLDRRPSGHRADRRRDRARARSLADADIARVSLVGAGMKTHPGVAATMFETLADEGVNIEMISTSPIRISCVVRADRGRAGGAGPARAPSSWSRRRP